MKKLIVLLVSISMAAFIVGCAQQAEGDITKPGTTSEKPADKPADDSGTKPTEGTPAPTDKPADDKGETTKTEGETTKTEGEAPKTEGEAPKTGN